VYGVDKVERVAGPKDLHEMQRLRHGGDVVESPMEAIIDAARRRAVAALERLLEFVGQPAQLGNVLARNLFYCGSHQLSLEQQPKLQDLAGGRRIERDDADTAI